MMRADLLTPPPPSANPPPARRPPPTSPPPLSAPARRPGEDLDDGLGDEAAEGLEAALHRVERRLKPVAPGRGGGERRARPPALGKCGKKGPSPDEAGRPAPSPSAPSTTDPAARSEFIEDGGGRGHGAELELRDPVHWRQGPLRGLVGEPIRGHEQVWVPGQ